MATGIQTYFQFFNKTEIFRYSFADCNEEVFIAPVFRARKKIEKSKMALFKSSMVAAEDGDCVLAPITE